MPAAYGGHRGGIPVKPKLVRYIGPVWHELRLSRVVLRVESEPDEFGRVQLRRTEGNTEGIWLIQEKYLALLDLN